MTHSPAPYNPSLYAQAVQGITCNNIATRYETVPSAQRSATMAVQPYRLGGPRKGDYETTEAFQQRLTKIVRDAYGNADPLVAIRSVDAVNSSYDADHQILKIKVFGENFSDSLYGSSNMGPKPDLFFDADVGNSRDSSYVGVNGFGSTRVVSKSSYEEIGYGFTSSDPHDPSVEISVDPAAAKQIREHGKIVFIAKFEDKPVWVGFDHDKPTFDDPTETYWDFYLMPVTPQCAVVLNGNSIVGQYTRF